MNSVNKKLTNGASNREKLGINHEFARVVVKPALIKLRGSNCGGCGVASSIKNLDMHHEDYNNQNINTLKLLCRKCHRRIHNDK